MFQSIKKPDNELNTALLTEGVFVAGSDMPLPEYRIKSIS